MTDAMALAALRLLIVWARAYARQIYRSDKMSARFLLEAATNAESACNERARIS